jgi:protein-disulfide isomerase
MRLLLLSPLYLLGIGGRGGFPATVSLVGFLLLVAASAAALTAPSYIGVERAPKTASRVAADLWASSPLLSLDPPVLEGPGRDYTRGSPDAPVTFVEFSDFECPACRAAFENIERVLHRYGGKVFFVYKNYPLDQSCNSSIQRPMHQNACYAAVVARCAGEQGRFFEAVSFLFSVQDVKGEVSDQEMRATIDTIKTRLSLDEKAFGECMSTTRHQEKLVRDVQEADRYGIQGTPTMWINGRLVPSFGEDALVSIIERALEQQ